MTQSTDHPFWKRKKLSEMNKEEWESLCDGCSRCCLHKLEDEETGEIHYTGVVCHLLDINKCSCTDYQQRSHLVPSCIVLDENKLSQLQNSDDPWVPKSCAYRRLSEGFNLEDWHPLVSQNPESVHESGISIRGKAISESHVDMEDLEDYIISDQESF